MNRGAGLKLEVPCTYRLYGPQVYVDKEFRCDLLDIYSKPVVSILADVYRQQLTSYSVCYWWVWLHCPLSEYWLKPVRGVIGVRCPELGGVHSRRFKCTVSIGKSIGGMSSVCCIRVCPLFRGSVNIRGFTYYIVMC